MRSIGAMTLGLLVLAGGPVATASAALPDPLRSQQWYLNTIKAPAPGLIPGLAGVKVAVLDTGVDIHHADFAGAVTAGPSFTGGSAAEDPNGHGTNVAGIIAARADNGVGVAGAASGVKVLSVRVLNAQQTGDTHQVAQGIDAAVAAGVGVINLSLGTDPSLATTINATDPVVPAMRRAISAGIVVVAAAGNASLPVCAQPLIVTGLLCVGAVDRALNLTNYSNYALRVDVVAPGGDEANPIISTAPGGGYASMLGTSQATPQVSALAAMLVAQGLHGQAVVDRIKQTTVDLGAPGVDLRFGSGLIDMTAATATLGAAAPRTASSDRAATTTINLPASLSARRLLRSDVIVACRLPAGGTCHVEVRAGGHLIARGQRHAEADQQTHIRLRPTAAGRRRLRTTHGFKATMRARGPQGHWASTTTWLMR
ncbi:MAG: Proprotein convertase in/kexin type 6 [Solirubrobacterales bacterium]|nr:Proprotein convertase in/kexin type 6 [Solirubrobacterales bacterium]